jgi:hypothetical protein
MELPNGVFFDELIKKHIFSYLPIKKFKQGVFMYPLCFFYNCNFHSSITRDNYHIEILRITKNFLFIKIILNDDFHTLFFKKKKKYDDIGEFIEFKECFMKNYIEISFYNRININHKFKFRPSFLLSSKI